MQDRLIRILRVCRVAILCAAPVVGPHCAAAENLVPLRVGVFKQSAQTPTWAAKTLGVFEKNGLNVELVEFRNGQEAVSAQQGGAVDIIPSTPGTVMIAVERGFDLEPIAQIEAAHARGPDTGSIQVLKESPIRSVADMAGKKLATASVRGPTQVGLQVILKHAGVNPASVQFVEAPYTSQVDLLRSKQIDAIATVDPYTTQLQASGLGRVISWNYVESIPEQPLGAFYAKHQFMIKQHDVVDRFARSIKEAMDYLNADEPRARHIVAEFTGLDPKMLEPMPLNRWDYRINRSVWQQVVDLLHEYGELEKPHNVDEFLSDYVKAQLP